MKYLDVNDVSVLYGFSPSMLSYLLSQVLEFSELAEAGRGSRRLFTPGEFLVLGICRELLKADISVSRKRNALGKLTAALDSIGEQVPSYAIFTLDDVFLGDEMEQLISQVRENSCAVVALGALHSDLMTYLESRRGSPGRAPKRRKVRVEGARNRARLAKRA